MKVLTEILPALSREIIVDGRQSNNDQIIVNSSMALAYLRENSSGSER